MLRDDVRAAMIAAMKAGDRERTGALRLIGAKVKDRDIELRTSAMEMPDDDLVIEVLRKMARQRRESIRMYDDGGRVELADRERAELAVIEEFLPAMMDAAATKAAIEQVKSDVGAKNIKDMGRVMGALKKRHAAELDMELASGLVKAALS